MHNGIVETHPNMDSMDSYWPPHVLFSKCYLSNHAYSRIYQSKNNVIYCSNQTYDV